MRELPQCADKADSGPDKARPPLRRPPGAGRCRSVTANFWGRGAAGGRCCAARVMFTASGPGSSGRRRISSSSSSSSSEMLHGECAVCTCSPAEAHCRAGSAGAGRAGTEESVPRQPVPLRELPTVADGPATITPPEKTADLILQNN